HWFQRWKKVIPKEGEISFLDRSWYTRAITEPIMGYCTENQYRLFMKKVNGWEKKLIDEGVELIKFYFSLSKDQQARRMNARKNSQLKYWKLSKNDEKIVTKWDAFLLFLSAKKFILDRRDPSQAAVTLIPVYSFFVAVIIGLVTARKGLKHVGLPLTDNEVVLVTIGFGVFVSIISAILLNINKEKIREYGVESAFAILMIVTASAMAFAHGSNDVANAIGPMSAIISVASEGAIGAKAAVSPWVLLIGGIGIVFGLSMLGGRVIKTVGSKITHLTPSLGFSAEMAAASTVVAATYIGFPISTTHTLVGAVIGVGLAKGVSHLDLSSIGRIILSWVVTIPAGASLTVLFYILIRLATGV
ncbi:inorganic phosphate transporter, partial [Gammaproteobacteria bacterium]|nr:inorganic phosphate transporter [Gammaproteobacteria bacterium]